MLRNILTIIVVHTFFFIEKVFAAIPQGVLPDNSAKLPSGDISTQFLPQVIKTILSVTGVIVFVMFILSGIFFLTARGNDDQLGKAKNILIYSLVGVVIIAVSYAIILGVTEFEFNK